MLVDFQSVNWETYSPGLLEQDLFTIPIQAGIVGMVTHLYTSPHAQPLWPFTTENTSGVRNPTRHRGRPTALVAGGLAAGTFGALSYTNDSFKGWPHFRGWIHAHLLTEISTIFAKTTFQRKRPHHDSELENGTLRNDDRLSFFSGHSSHAFTVATYSSAMVRQYSKSPVLAWIYTGGIYGISSWVAAARAVDGQHHWSDVITGATVGFAISYALFHRVEKVIAEDAERRKEILQDNSKIDFNISPNFGVNALGERAVSLDLNLKF